jgi:nucleoside-diphosphate-sugar epimerase
MNVFVLGANGFIGSHLIDRILEKTDWTVTAFDLRDDNLRGSDNPRLSIKLGDLYEEDRWIEKQIADSDVVLPLAGIAKPAYYITNPLMTFELDFEQNLKIVRMCSEHGVRIIFPSTSEVYGMSTGDWLMEDESLLIQGPIKNSRWIYSCSKQMMDRVISAYGQEKGLPYTLFRPFNWIGPRLDTFRDAEERKARSITQMIYDVSVGRPITLVDGGRQRRSFTYVTDGVDALIAIIADAKKSADGEIFNIGNPDSNHSIKGLAVAVVDAMKDFPKFAEAASKATFVEKNSTEYYGRGYEDVQDRKPSISKAEELLDWHPQVDFHEAVRRTVAFYANRP